MKRACTFTPRAMPRELDKEKDGVKQKKDDEERKLGRKQAMSAK